MNPYINDNLDISLLSDQDKKEILVWADECTQGYITHRAHYEMERCTTPIVFSPSLWNNLPKETVDPEWIYAYARHSILFNLAKAYALTKEQKYLNTFKDTLVIVDNLNLPILGLIYLLINNVYV